MIEFLSISPENENPKDDFQLENLGPKRHLATIGSFASRNYWGEMEYPQSQTFYRDTKPDDYNCAFAHKLSSCEPPYDLDKILDYHLNYYISDRNGDKTRFINHIKFVILPKVKKQKNKEVYVELITNWIDMNDSDKKKEKYFNIKIGDINAPTQLQMNSENAIQSQTISYENNEIKKLFELIEKDLENIKEEIKNDLIIEIENAKKQLDKGKNIKLRLLTIGGMVKDIGIGLFTNLISSPLIELIK